MLLCIVFFTYLITILFQYQILEKLDLGHHFSSVKEHFEQHILPCVYQLLAGGEDIPLTVYSEQEEEELLSLITKVVQESSTQPQEVLVDQLILIEICRLQCLCLEIIRQACYCSSLC